jgi:ribosomal protein L22
MPDEHKDEQQKPKGGEEKPKRRRSSAARKPAAKKPAEGSKQPARRRAPAKAKEGGAVAKAEAKPATPSASLPKEEPAEQEETKAPAAAKTKPARRRASRAASKRGEPAKPPVRPVVMARARYVRSSARKARLVLDHVRGKSIADARAVLRHSPRGVARDLERLLDSAVANAENNHDLVGDDLLVKEVYADEGPTLKRFRARAQGRAFRVRKRTSHLTMTLTPKE